MKRKHDLTAQFGYFRRRKCSRVVSGIELKERRDVEASWLVHISPILIRTYAMNSSISHNPSNDNDPQELSNEATQSPEDYMQRNSHMIVPEVRVLFLCTQAIILDVTHLRLEQPGAKHLSVLIYSMPNLMHLKLGDNNFGSWGIRELVPALKHKTLLEELSLESNFIGRDGAIDLALCLSPLKKLRSLNLSMNDIDSVGAVALANAISNLRLLETLQLSFNRLGDEGLIPICNAIRGFPYLQDIGLCDNEISSASVPAMVEAFSTLANLEKVVLGYNPGLKNEDKFRVKKVRKQAIHFGSYERRCCCLL
mmetsp:Transcript_13288/g.24927  ORF Transcript_13288/g.24927 Transcript_13288/m.24927 type:complete len:310 (-) Transcript_13288:2300-3229(-)